MDKVLHTEADRAVWLIYCAYYTAEMMGGAVKDVVRLFDRYNIADWLLSGYRSFHTQGFEYMAELISDRIHEEAEGARPHRSMRVSAENKQWKMD